MKFFTLERYHDDYPDGVAEWPEHVQRMKQALPESMHEILGQDLFDDALIVSVDHDQTNRSLTLTLRCGNLQVGYYDLILSYSDASISKEHNIALAKIARGFEYDVKVYTDEHIFHLEKCSFYDGHQHEIDVTNDGRFEHRLLFNPGVWFAIQFSDLHWRKIDRLDRIIPPILDRYPSGPHITD